MMGDWYIIPNQYVDQFNYMCEEINQCDSSSDEFYDLTDQLEIDYGHYRTNGDLNNIQLYVVE